MSNNTIVDVIVRQPLTANEISSYIAVPVGGSTGQVLSKASNTTGDLVWINNAAAGTDLSITNKTATQFTLESSNGADVIIPSASTTEAGLLSAANLVKLNGLSAQVNSDWNSVGGLSQILNKPSVFPSNIASVSGLQTALDGKFNIPLGDITQYVAGDGSLISFDGDLTAIASLSGTGYAKRTGINTWVLDNSAFLTANQTITLSGDVSGSGTTAITVTLPNVATAGTYKSVTINAKGQVTGGTNPTTLSGYGITDAQGLNSILTSVSGLSTITTGNVKLTNGVASLDTNTYYLASNPNGYTTNTGTVTTASVVSANGFAGSVATAGTTPAITISTTITGLLKGNGTAISAATAGTDYLTPTGSAAGLTGLTSGQVTTALGFTPYNSTNPAGYTTNTGTVTTFSFTNGGGFTGTVSTAGTTPTLSLTLQNATTSQSGQLTSTDWNTFNNKQPQLSGTGFVKVSGTTVSYDNSTYLTGNQTITVTGDASGSGSTAITLTLGSNVVSNAKLAQVATGTFKGRISASTGNVEDLSGSQATTLLDTFTSTTKGLVGASGGGTTNFLRADGTWAAPAGGGGGGLTLTEFEVDFGTKPVRSKKFTITAVGVTGTSKVIVSPSGNVATGRVGNDWEWDSINTSAKAGTGQFTLTCFASGKIAGKRKFYYTYS